MVWEVNDFQIEVCKVKQPSSLMVVKVLGLMEVHQVFVVGEDLDREGGSMEIVPPGLQGMYDCEEFLVIDVIVLFCWDE